MHVSFNEHVYFVKTLQYILCSNQIASAARAKARNSHHHQIDAVYAALRFRTFIVWTLPRICVQSFQEITCLNLLLKELNLLRGGDVRTLRNTWVRRGDSCYWAFWEDSVLWDGYGTCACSKTCDFCVTITDAHYKRTLIQMYCYISEALLNYGFTSWRYRKIIRTSERIFRFRSQNSKAV